MERRGEEDGRGNCTSFSIDLTKQLEELPEKPSEPCIYRVPPTLRPLNEKAYTPQVVSIGPFHHDKEELKGMKEFKLRCVKVFLSRTTKSLDDFITAVNQFEKRARNYYGEKISLCVDKFVRMLIVDCFFIFEAMIDKSHDCLKEIDSALNTDKDFYVPMNPLFLTRDIILLENQIPFFVLNELFQLAFPEEDRRRVFLKLSIDYIFDVVMAKNSCGMAMLEKVEEYLKSEKSNHEIKHLVDLLRICHLPSNLRSQSSEELIMSEPNAMQPSKKPFMSVPNLLRICHLPSTLRSQSSEELIISEPNAMQPSKEPFISVPNAMQLQEAGIQLKSGKSKILLDIEYKEGELTIPEWVNRPWSEIVLSNILVLENCCYFKDSYIRDYVFFMQKLVDTDKDADLLIQNRIIDERTGRSSNVVTLFNKLGSEFLFYNKSFHFYGESENLIAYCNVDRHKWMTTFKRKHCSTPLIIASTAAAVILLLLTLASTIAAFLALFV